MNLAFEVIFRVLEAMFVVGLVGCLFVIPQTAYMMMRVLVGADHGPSEDQPVDLPAIEPKGPAILLK